MNKWKRMVLAIVSLIVLMSTVGCWNYIEIEDMSIVAGVAIDKGASDGKLLVTAEIVDTKEGSKSSQAGFKMLSLTGETMFDIVRGMISITGKKLFWSHSKAIILSEEIAREGVINIIDWYNRDTETRSDVYIFVSKEKTAQEIINLSSLTESIMAYALAQQMRFENSVSTAPVVEIWDFIDKLEASGEYAIAPLIYIHETNKIKNARVSGAAIFSMDKMIGTISGEETKYMLFANNQIKGGVLAVNDKNGKPAFSLEILSNRTKVKPVWVEGKLQMQINTLTHTGLDEVKAPEEFTNRDSKKVIEKRAGEELQKAILSVIHRVQKDYHADIFGFGELLHEQMPQTWKKIEKDWGKEFSEVEVVVNSEVIIDSSAQTSRSIKIHQKGD
ncbi:Ger(x)C family spore germination protein [Paenibacillus sp. B2(2019)]|uniref:Ger(x)C family spore germination protein n=1 Tax=Paenibacillus sp. B2(2019) TaxID=2607754 RepID=UPI0011F3E209|nr:Ger(x)C family spore germination protein [Paenibacillus sp. B2(2019)]KAA1190301.1 Ger(x)C family spore germination protein [Paenibacillus sp. B2(2019)]